MTTNARTLRRWWLWGGGAVLLLVALLLALGVLLFTTPELEQREIQLTSELVTSGRARRGELATLMQQTGQARFLPYLVETYRFEQGNKAFQNALETLSGQRFAGKRALRQWFEWLWSQPFSLDETFFSWKRSLYAHELPNMAPLLHNEGTLDWRTVVWGGVPPGGIPALNEPALLSADEADYLSADDIVFGAFVGGQARAYPVRIVDWHELVNDTLGGEPVVLSYCPLCGSALLYSRAVGNVVYTFDTSGLLYESNKLMYDRQTLSLWPNLSGVPLSGPLAGTNVVLKRFPLVTTTWGRWVQAHPDTQVLDPGTGPSGTNEDYDLYRVERDLLAPISHYDGRLAPKDWVYGVVSNGRALAYAVEALQAVGLLNDAFAGTNLVLIADPVPGSQYGFYPATVRAFQRGDHRFSQDAEGLRDERGALWSVGEKALTQPQTGEVLLRVQGQSAYWFAWSTLHPQTELRQPAAPNSSP